MLGVQIRRGDKMEGAIKRNDEQLSNIILQYAMLYKLKAIYIMTDDPKLLPSLVAKLPSLTFFTYPIDSVLFSDGRTAKDTIQVTCFLSLRMHTLHLRRTSNRKKNFKGTTLLGSPQTSHVSSLSGCRHRRHSWT